MLIDTIIFTFMFIVLEYVTIAHYIGVGDVYG